MLLLVAGFSMPSLQVNHIPATPPAIGAPDAQPQETSDEDTTSQADDDAPTPFVDDEDVQA